MQIRPWEIDQFTPAEWRAAVEYFERLGEGVE